MITARKKLELALERYECADEIDADIHYTELVEALQDAYDNWEPVCECARERKCLHCRMAAVLAKVREG